MNYTEWKFLAEYPINQISDIAETKTHYVLRGARAIYFMDKESRTITHTIPLAIDHEFGYKLLEANKEACFVVVHCESQSKEDVFGDPTKPHLQSFSTQGLNWSYALSGWSIGANYGGVFLFDERLVFTEKQEGDLVTVVLDAATGEVLQKTAGHRYRHHSGNHLGMLQSLKDSKHKRIYHTVNSEGLYVTDLQSKELSTRLLLSYRPKTLAQNEDFIYCHGFKDDKTYFFVIDKISHTVKEEIIVDDKINIEQIIASNDSNYLLLMHEDCSVSGFDLLNKEIKWKIAQERKTKIYQGVIDKNNLGYLFWKKPSTFIDIVNIQTGEVLQNIQPVKGKFYQPFFVLGNVLFVADFNKVYCFERR